MLESKVERGAAMVSRLCSLATIVFAVLRVTNVIDWSWLWVLSPLWGLFAVAWSLILIGKILGG